MRHGLVNVAAEGRDGLRGGGKPEEIQIANKAVGHVWIDRRDFGARQVDRPNDVSRRQHTAGVR